MNCNEWKEISEGMLKDVAYEVMQKGGRISIGAFIQTNFTSGINQLKETEKGVFCTTNTFLMKVEKFRELS